MTIIEDLTIHDLTLVEVKPNPDGTYPNNAYASRPARVRRKAVCRTCGWESKAGPGGYAYSAQFKHLEATRTHLEAAIRHTNRFRQVSNRYPRQVAIAYGRDIARAAADSDETVAATVAAWELANGLPVRDWQAIGAAEREDDER